MLVFHVMLTLLLALVIWLDFTRYTIPNWLNGLILLLYPLMAALTPEPVDWLGALLPALAVFVVCVVFFVLRVMGGGDVKLLAVSSVWMGKPAILEFLLYTAVIGGVLTLGLLALRPMAPWIYGRFLSNRPVPKVFTVDQPIPYGVAIAGVFMLLLWRGKIPGIPPLEGFLS